MTNQTAVRATETAPAVPGAGSTANPATAAHHTPATTAIQTEASEASS